jgi:hypothetical protein
MYPCYGDESTTQHTDPSSHMLEIVHTITRGAPQKTRGGMHGSFFCFYYIDFCQCNPIRFCQRQIQDKVLQNSICPYYKGFFFFFEQTIREEKILMGIFIIFN